MSIAIPNFFDGQQKTHLVVGLVHLLQGALGCWARFSEKPKKEIVHVAERTVKKARNERYQPYGGSVAVQIRQRQKDKSSAYL